MTLEMLSISTVASRLPTPPACLGQPGDCSPTAGPVAWCSEILQDLLPPQDLHWFLLPGKSVPSLHGSCLASSREAFPDHSHPPLPHSESPSLASFFLKSFHLLKYGIRRFILSLPPEGRLPWAWIFVSFIHCLFLAPRKVPGTKLVPNKCWLKDYYYYKDV